MSERLFRVADADALVPRLAELFRAVRTDLEAAQRLVAELNRRGFPVAAQPRSRPAPPEVRRLQDELHELSARIADRLEEVRALGAEVKAVDGLVDFRSRLGGRVVYLCWRFGEDRVRFWHELDGGFAGRRPLTDPEAFAGDYLQ